MQNTIDSASLHMYTEKLTSVLEGNKKNEFNLFLSETECMCGIL